MPRPLNSGSKDLFELIQSMDKSEKRYFKIHAGKQKDAVYLKLFKLIEAQEEYDEAALKKKLKGQAVVNNLHVAKKYLFDSLMDSLILYHKRKSINYQLKNLLFQIDICNKKGLHQISYRLLKNAEKLALDNEKFNFLLEILALKKINLMDRTHKGYSTNEIHDIDQLEKTTLTKIEQIAYYKSKIVALFSEYVKWESIRKPKKSEFFKKMVKDPMFLDESNADSFEAKILLFTLKGYYYHDVGAFDKSIVYRRQIIGLIESSKKFVKIYSRNYLVALHNFITDLRMLKRYSEMGDQIEKYGKLPTEDFSSKAEQFRRYYIMKTQFLLDTGKFEETVDLEENFNNQLPYFEDTISRSIVKLVQYQFALCYFGLGKFERTAKILNGIINDNKQKEDKGINGFSQIWLIFTHYELGNFNILPYLSKSAKKYFEKNKVLFKIEKKVFDFFIKEKYTDAAYPVEKLMDLKAYIQKYNNPANDKNMIYNLMQYWLQSKIEKKSLAQVIKS